MDQISVTNSQSLLSNKNIFLVMLNHVELDIVSILNDFNFLILILIVFGPICVVLRKLQLEVKQE